MSLQIEMNAFQYILFECKCVLRLNVKQKNSRSKISLACSNTWGSRYPLFTNCKQFGAIVWTVCIVKCSKSVQPTFGNVNEFHCGICMPELAKHISSFF